MNQEIKYVMYVIYLKIAKNNIIKIVKIFLNYLIKMVSNVFPLNHCQVQGLSQHPD